MSTPTLSREDQRAYRLHLRALADRLSDGVARLTAEATQPTGAEGAEAESPAGQPAVTSGEGDEEVARGVLRTEEDLFVMVRDALDRLDTGTFGRCGRCGQRISRERLQALPYARHCIRCAHAGNDTAD